MTFYRGISEGTGHQKLLKTKLNIKSDNKEKGGVIKEDESHGSSMSLGNFGSGAETTIGPQNVMRRNSKKCLYSCNF